MEKKIELTFEDWEINPEQLTGSLRVEVGVSLPHPPLEQVIAFQNLKDRVRFSRQFYQKALDTLVEQLAVSEYKLNDKREFRLFWYHTTLGQLQSRLVKPVAGNVWIREIEGFSKKPVPEREHYFCLKLLFKIQFEGIRNGNQLYEEQFVLIQAATLTEAKEQLQSGYITESETPYLNSDRRLVRWKFVKFLDDDQPYIFKDIQEQIHEGIEVYSKEHWKRRKAGDNWDGSLE